MPLVSPSLLSADFGHLADDIAMLNRSAAQWLHCDVMDGVFVPNISFGFPVMEAMARDARKPLDVHLMIVQPEKFIREVKALGAKVMNVHYEACTHLHRVVQQIRRDAAITTSVKTVAEHDLVVDMDMEGVFSLQMHVVSQAQATLLERTFQKNAEKIYDILLDAVTRDYSREGSS